MLWTSVMPSLRDTARDGQGQDDMGWWVLLVWSRSVCVHACKYLCACYLAVQDTARDGQGQNNLCWWVLIVWSRCACAHANIVLVGSSRHCSRWAGAK